MKSENDLKITGIVVSDITPKPGQNKVKFRIVHYFGERKKPLFLDCIQIIKPGMESPVPQKGNAVRVRAYLQMRGDRIEAIVKSLDFEP